MIIKIFLAIVMAIPLFCNSSYAGEGIAQEAINYYNEGVQAQKENNFFVASTLYQKAILLGPGKDILKQLLNNYGAMNAKAQEFATAEKLFKQALAVDIHYRPAALNLGLIFDKQQDKLKSMTFWLLAFNIDIDAMKPKKYILFGVPDLKGKGVLYSDQQDPTSQAALLNAKAIMYIQQGDIKKAEATLNDAVKIDPTFMTAKLNLGLIYDLGQDKVMALEYWIKVFKIELDSRKPKDYVLEGSIVEKIR